MGTALEPGTILRAWYRVLERADVGHVRWHDLRHAHATLMLGAGVHPKVVSERLGHASVGMTLDTYSHVLPGLQAAAALDDMIDEQVDAAGEGDLLAKRRRPGRQDRQSGRFRAQAMEREHGIRTRDILLGKQTLYRLSYSRPADPRERSVNPTLAQADPSADSTSSRNAWPGHVFERPMPSPLARPHASIEMSVSARRVHGLVSLARFRPGVAS